MLTSKRYFRKLSQCFLESLFVDWSVQNAHGESPLLYKSNFGRKTLALHRPQSSQNKRSIAGYLDIESITRFG